MNRFVMIMTIIFGLNSCRCSNDKIVDLKRENKKLHYEIDSLKARIGEYKFMPIVFPKSPKIK